MLGNLLTRSVTLIGDVFGRAGQANLVLISAGVAFFGMFGLFPAIAAILSVFGLLSNPVVVLEQFELLKGVIPGDAYFLLEAQLHKLLFARSSSLTWATLLSFGLAFWSARIAVAALVQGLNAVYGVRNRRTLKHTFVALVLTGALVLVALVALTAVVIAPVLVIHLPFSKVTVQLLEVIRWGVVLLTLLSGLTLLYRFGPNLEGARPPWLSAGAVLVIILWFMASMGLSAYFSNFGRYNEIYGSIGAVIAMQTWLFITAYLVMLGAAFDVELRRACGLTRFGEPRSPESKKP